MGRLHGPSAWCIHLLVSVEIDLYLFSALNITTYSEELCASVVGYSNSCYRCCESVDEGNQALRAFLARQSDAAIPPGPTAQTIPGPAHPALPADNTWWCCFIGAEPGVYQGL